MKLGQTVKDKITGFEGIVDCISVWMHGTDRIEVQPRELKDGQPQMSHSFDDTQVEIIDETQLVKAEVPKERFTMGDKLTDPITDFEGVYTGRATHLNGCARVFIVSKQNKEGKIITKWIDEPQVELVKEKVIKPGSKKTGGPLPYGTSLKR